MSFLRRLLHKKKIEKIWNKKNKENFSSINLIGCSIDKLQQVYVGKKTYGCINLIAFDKIHELHIGSYCSIAPNVSFILSGDHYMNHFSTYPFYNKIIDGRDEAISKGNIVISDDVWIGMNSTILSGVTVGKGAIIAACSVVTKSVPPYAIVAGNPAKIIKYRFTNDVIEKLLGIDISTIKEKKIVNNIDFLYKDVNSDNVDEIIEKLFKEEK